eukprot:scaffold702782_cov47-Attheya_sp.AAC.1
MGIQTLSDQVGNGLALGVPWRKEDFVWNFLFLAFMSTRLSTSYSFKTFWMPLNIELNTAGASSLSSSLMPALGDSFDR